jgi:hypothetical protein
MIGKVILPNEVSNPSVIVFGVSGGRIFLLPQRAERVVRQFGFACNNPDLPFGFPRGDGCAT